MSTATSAVGHQTHLSFGFESTFGGGASGDRYPFGLDPSLGSAEGNHNLVRGHEPGSRDATQINEQQFSGSVSVDFQITNPHFLGALIAAESAGAWSGEMPQSIAIVAGHQGNIERELVGGIVTSGTISASENDPVTVTLEITFADENPNTTISDQPAVEHTGMFFHNTETLRGGNKIGHMREIEISIENNAELKHDEGSRIAPTWTAYNRDISFDYTDFFVDDSNLSRYYGGNASSGPEESISNTADATATFDNGTESIELALDGILPNTFSVDGYGDVEADLEESLEEYAHSISASSSGYGLGV